MTAPRRLLRLLAACIAALAVGPAANASPLGTSSLAASSRFPRTDSATLEFDWLAESLGAPAATQTLRAEED